MLRTTLTAVIFVATSAWGGSTAQAQQASQFNQSNNVLPVCKQNQVYFDGKCRGSRFFEKLTAKGYSLVGVAGCRPEVGKKSANSKSIQAECGQTVSFTESKPPQNRTLTLLASSISSGASKRPTGNSLSPAKPNVQGPKRQGYRIVAKDTFDVTSYLNGDRTASTKAYLYDDDGEAHEVFRHDVTFEASQGLDPIDVHVQICGAAPLAEILPLAEPENPQSPYSPRLTLDCSGGSCAYHSVSGGEYNAALDGNPTSSLTADLRRDPPIRLKSANAPSGYSEAISNFMARRQSSEYACWSGPGVADFGVIQAYSSSPNIGASHECLASVSGVETYFTNGCPAHVISNPGAGVAIGIGGYIQTVANYAGTISIGSDGGSGISGPLVPPIADAYNNWFASYEAVTSFCGALYSTANSALGTPSQSGFADSFCPQAMGVPCEGRHNNVLVEQEVQSGVQCTFRVDVECTSTAFSGSTDQPSLGDAGCECEPVSAPQLESCR